MPSIIVFLLSPISIRFPFKKSLYEYAFELVIEYVGVYYIMDIAACLMAFLVAFCIMISSIVKDLRTDLVTLNVNDMSKGNSMEEIRKIIFSFIQLHIHALELSKTNTFSIDKISYFHI